MILYYRMRYENCIGRTASYDGFCETNAKTTRGILRAIARDFVAQFHTDICELISFETPTGIIQSDFAQEYYTWRYVKKYLVDWRYSA